MATHTSLAGSEVRVRLGAVQIGGSLSLSFTNRSDADTKQVTDHYLAVQSSFAAFDLPADVFAGMASWAHVTPTAFKWRYLGAPSVEYVAPGVSTVKVSLQSVPD